MEIEDVNNCKTFRSKLNCGQNYLICRLNGGSDCEKQLLTNTPLLFMVSCDICVKVITHTNWSSSVTLTFDYIL